MNRKSSKGSFLFLILCIILPNIVLAQVNDAALWTSLSLNKKLNNRIAVSLQQECRFNENISEAGRVNTSAGVAYKISKTFRVGGYYRFSMAKQLDGSYIAKNRYYGEATARFKLKRLQPSLRFRYQHQFNEFNSDKEDNNISNYLRTKLSVKYDTNKRFVPYVSGELWTNINAKLNDNIRCGAGVDYTIDKRQSIQCSYLVDHEFNVKNPLTSYIVQIGYDYSF